MPRARVNRSMRCTCGSRTSVINSRPTANYTGTTRRRRCRNPACLKRYTTVEMRIEDYEHLKARSDALASMRRFFDKLE